MTTNELTYPLNGFKPGMRTNVAKGILTNKDAALLILAANGGTLDRSEVTALLRGWRPAEGQGPNIVKRGRFDLKRNKWVPPVVGTGPSELHFSYLFNAYYGHISDDYNRTEGDRGGWLEHRGGKNRYSSGPYMWRPKAHTAAISALGRARLRSLVEACQAAGMVLAPEVLESAAKA